MSRRRGRRGGGRRARAFALAMALMALAACARDPTAAGEQSIAGFYMLMSVELPAPSPDPGAGVVIGGRLALAPAAPEAYVFTPAGTAVARSCVHEIPNGAMVDTANVVHLPDGSSYELPRCGKGTYKLVFTRQYRLADGSTRTASDSTTGLYTWGVGVIPGADASGVSILTLVDAGLAGPISFTEGGPVFQLTRQHVGPPIAAGPPEPVYTFSRGWD